MIQIGDSGGVVMVYADYGYMLEKKEKVLQKKIALQIWEGPRLYTPCAEKHLCIVFFIVPNCPNCSHDKLSWSCFLCVFGYFPGFESIFEHLNHYFLHLCSVVPGGFWKDSESILLCYVWCDSCKQFSDWRRKKKTVRGTSGVAGEFPVLHHDQVCLLFFLAWETICWSEEVGVRTVQCFTGNSLLFLLFEYYASCHHKPISIWVIQHWS